MEKKKESIFSELRRGLKPQPAPAAPPQAAPAYQHPAPPQPDPRVPELENEVVTLRAELEALKARFAASFQPPPPPPQKPPRELIARLERYEAVLDELRGRVARAETGVEAAASGAASGGDLKNVELRVADLTEAFDGLKRALSGESELAARLASYEAALSDMKASLDSAREAEKRELSAMAPRAELEPLRVSLSAASTGLEEIKKDLLRYAGDFASVESECRKALGEMQGFAKSLAQKPLQARFDDYMKGSLSRTNAKLCELETALHSGISELAGRLNSNEVLYEKVFMEAEQRVKDGVAPEIKAFREEIKWLRENVIKMTDLYTVVLERKMRLLEGKYSAFEAISGRMESIEEALKEARREERL